MPFSVLLHYLKERNHLFHNVGNTPFFVSVSPQPSYHAGLSKAHVLLQTFDKTSMKSDLFKSPVAQ